MNNQRSSSHQAILTPPLDILCCGGLSIAGITSLLVFAFFFLPKGALSEITLQEIFIANALINWPHFIASYRILYRSKSQVLQYRWSSLYVPAMIVLLASYGIIVRSSDPTDGGLVNGAVIELLSVAGIYLLAWHYTGQAWGMVASYMYIAGIKMERMERWLIRLGIRCLLVWHLLWALTWNDLALAFEDWLPGSLHTIEALYFGWSVVCLLTVPIGLFGFWKIYRRTKLRIPLCAFLPWVAIYLWYVLIGYCPGAFIVVQLSHALQYLSFPIRVEMNQFAHDKNFDAERQRLHAVMYYFALVVVGVAIHVGPIFAYWIGDIQLQLVTVVALGINLHHYFIDGAIWKISNPMVRRDLFAHIPKVKA